MKCFSYDDCQILVRVKHSLFFSLFGRRFFNRFWVLLSPFTTEDGVEEALFYHAEKLKKTEIVGFFAKAEKISPKLLEISHRWRETMSRFEISLRGFAPEHGTLKEFRKTDQNLGETFKSIPHETYSSNCSIDATALFVRIVLFDVNQAIIIENLEIVKTIRQIFEERWLKYK